MRKLSCIITDDEPVARKILQEFIGQVPYLELTAQFENVAKTEAFLRSQKADILFLDIEMPKITGLEFLKNHPVQPLTILTTAYPEYALESYEVDIIDYLLKPIAFSRFLKSLQRAKEYLDRQEAEAKELSFLFVRSEKRIEKIDLNDIFYVESVGNYVYIITGTKKIAAWLTLKSVESQLPPNQFVKVHQSYLVNFSRIDLIEGNQIVIHGKVLPLGRNYKDTLMRMVDERLLRR